MTIGAVSPQTQHNLRRWHLMGLADNLRYLLALHRTRVRNRTFTAEHPGFALPPAGLAYDAYAAPNWPLYKEGGECTASFLADLVRRHHPANCRVLDWGCGPARVVRHLPGLLPKSVIHATDFNIKSVHWCSQNIPGVTFAENGLLPPLRLPSLSFDFVYSISVFTHLSKASAKAWVAEVKRLLAPGGMFVFSTMGDSSVPRMLSQEAAEYRQRGMVTRSGVAEGKRGFVSYHSPQYVRRLFSAFDVLEHIPDGFPYVTQDLWVMRKAL